MANSELVLLFVPCFLSFSFSFFLPRLTILSYFTLFLSMSQAETTQNSCSHVQLILSASSTGVPLSLSLSLFLSFNQLTEPKFYSSLIFNNNSNNNKGALHFSRFFPSLSPFYFTPSLPHLHKNQQNNCMMTKTTTTTTTTASATAAKSIHGNTGNE